LQEFRDIKLLADLSANVISSYSIEFVVNLIDTFLTVGTGFVEKVNMIIFVLMIKEDVVAS
jgi:hypothetical protein